MFHNTLVVSSSPTSSTTQSRETVDFHFCGNASIAELLDGTCTMLRPVSILKSSPETWPADPTHENLCAARRGLFKDIFFVECDGGHGDLKVPVMWATGARERSRCQSDAQSTMLVRGGTEPAGRACTLRVCLGDLTVPTHCCDSIWSVVAISGDQRTTLLFERHASEYPVPDIASFRLLRFAK